MKGISTQFNQFRFFFAFLLMVGLTSQVAAANLTAVANGNWNSNATWGLGAGTYSGTTDAITIPAGITVTLQGTSSCASLATSGSGTATLGGTNRTFTVSGNITIVGGSTLSITNTGENTCTSLVTSGSGTATLSNVDLVSAANTGELRLTTPTVSGTCPLSIGASDINPTGAGTWTFDVNVAAANFTTAVNGTVTIAGTGDLTLSANINNVASSGGSTSNITINSTVVCATVAGGAGANNLTVGATGTLELTGTATPISGQSAVTFNTGSTVKYSRSGTQTVFSDSYSHLILSGSSAKTLTTGTTYGGNLTLSGTATATTVEATSIAGDLTVGTGTTFATGATNTWTLSVAGTTTVGGTLTLANTGLKTFTGLLTVSGTYNNSGNSAVTVKGGITNTGTFTAGSGLYTLNTSDQSLTGNMTINNITVTGVVLTIPAGTTLTSAGTITNAGTISNQGVIAKTGGFSNGSTYKSAVGVTGSFTTSLFTNTGSVSPGGSIGCLSFGAGFTNAGAVNIEVNGSTTACTDFDKITVTGTATLAGTLNITTGFSPVADFSIDILTATTVSGTFATVTVPDAHWTITYPAGAVRLNYSAILPVELAQFSANTEGSKTKLFWQTASEFNTKNFDIERSADGLTFEKIGEVLAYGKPNDYNFADESPRNGINYYRLKTNDLDGSADYSKIASVTFEGKAGKAKVYPNPVGTEGVLNVETSSDIQTIFITNAVGQVVLTSKLSKINVSQLPTGLYHVTVQAGNDVKTEKFFKQ